MRNPRSEVSDPKLRADANDLIADRYKDRYSFGSGVVSSVGKHVATQGRRALVITNPSRWIVPTLRSIAASLRQSGVSLVGDIIYPGARPGAPLEDVSRIASRIQALRPDVVVAVGGGSVIDACKAGITMATAHTGRVDAAAAVRLPLVAVQTSLGNASHLTNLAWVADSKAHRNRVISDEAIVPRRAIFDVAIARTIPTSVMLDGAFYGVFRCIQAALSSGGQRGGGDVSEMIGLGMELILGGLSETMNDLTDEDARDSLRLGTDLAGLAAISRGRKQTAAEVLWYTVARLPGHMQICAVLAPYMAAALAPMAEEQLHMVGEIYHRGGYIEHDPGELSGRKLGISVADGMLRAMRESGYSTSLPSIPGLSWKDIIQGLKTAVSGRQGLNLTFGAANESPTGSQTGSQTGSEIHSGEEAAPHVVVATERELTLLAAAVSAANAGDLHILQSV